LCENGLVPGKSHVKVLPKILRISSWECCTLFIWTGGLVSLHVVNVTWIDLDYLAIILYFLNRF
jgi:hypothetical protein